MSGEALGNQTEKIRIEYYACKDVPSYPGQTNPSGHLTECETSENNKSCYRHWILNHYSPDLIISVAPCEEIFVSPFYSMIRVDGR